MYWTTTLRRDGPQEVFLHTDTKGHRPERVFMQEERRLYSASCFCLRYVLYGYPHRAIKNTDLDTLFAMAEEMYLTCYNAAHEKQGSMCAVEYFWRGENTP